MNRLIDDNSLGERVTHSRQPDWLNCDMQVESAGHSMMPDYPPGTYLSCSRKEISQLVKGGVYVFWVRIHSGYNYVLKRFDGVSAGVILISALNSAYNPCEPIQVDNLLEVYLPLWRYTKETHVNE